MPDGNVEVQLARVDERLKMVLDELNDSKNSRKAQYEAVESLRTDLVLLKKDVSDVKSQLATAQPTIQEFITIKQRVVGAGAFGKWLWVAGAALLGLIAGSREQILHWLTGAPK